MIRADLLAVAAKAADRLLSHPWKLWFWGDSIGIEGLLDAAELTGDGRYLGYVHGLLKGWIARENFRSEFDYTAPGVALLRVFERTQDLALLNAARRHAGYLAGFRKTAGGAYMRYENAAIELPPEIAGGNGWAGSSGAVSDGGPCVFVDCMHFDGPFFARLFAVTREERYRELAIANILPQIELLFDPAEGLFHHFWMERTGRRNGILWARGNGWGLLGTALTLEDIGGESVASARLREILESGIKRLAGLQHSSGGWHTILTDTGSYVETSTAAFFTDIICRAIRLGLVSAAEYGKVLEAAMRFLLRQVREDGALDGVSYETFPSTRPEHYRTMPRGAVVPWGQGPLIAAVRSYVELVDSGAHGSLTAGREERSHATR